jgi:plastocyanin
MEETLFYVFGGALVVSAVLVSIVGLRMPDFPGSRAVLAGVIAYFALLVGASATFAVLNAAKDQRDRNAEKAAEAPAPAAPATTTESTTSTTAAPAKAQKPLKLAADATQLAYDTTKLSSAAGSVTIDFQNPSAVQHDVCLEDSSGGQLGCSDIVAQGAASVTADVQAGSYAFFCSVDGHRAAGMEGTLTVK